jgi:hypothetical protein
MDKKEELKKRIAINSLKNKVKANLPSFTLIKIYENNEADFAYYQEKLNENWDLFQSSKLNEKLNPVGNNDEHYCEWILSEISDIRDSDEWLITSRNSYGYWAKIRSSQRFEAIKELWHSDKDTGGQKPGYSTGFFAINTNINMIIRVGCFLGGRNKDYNSENYYTLITQRVIIAVIYTGDIKYSADIFDVGALRIQIEQVFLSKFDTDDIYIKLKTKIEAMEALTDDDIMRLIILPLTQPDKTRKQKLIEDAIDLAKQVTDEQQQLFIMAGIVTATRKFIDHKYSETLKGWIKMSHLARLFEEEKVEAVNEALRNDRLRTARDMLAEGDDIIKVMRVTRLTRAELETEQSLVSA